MSDTSVQLVAAVFTDEPAAKAALTALRQVKKEKVTGVQGAILIAKDESGQNIHYKDVGLTPGKGALGGVVLGATVGILTGGAGLVFGAAGAALGGVVGKKKQDSRFDANQLNQIGAALKPGGAAIVAVVESDGVTAVTTLLEQQQADWLIADISADLARQLQAHRDEAHLLLEQKLQQDK